jgi:hypothetical protein
VDSPYPKPRGRRWETFAAYVVSYYGGLCHLCDHGGARQADHLESVADRPDLAFSLPNCRPAHGAPGNPCRECTLLAGKPVYCNQLRGPMSVERGRRLIAEMTGGGQAARQPERHGPDPAAGREW